MVSPAVLTTLGARQLNGVAASAWSGCEWWGVALAMKMHRDGVDAEGVGEHVEGLAEMADAVCPTQPDGVVEVTVDAFGVVAAPVEPFEVGITGRDRPHVLGAIELALAVLIITVETDRDHGAAVVGRESVVILPAEGAGLGLVAMGADPLEYNEGGLTGLGELAEGVRPRRRRRTDG